MRVRALKKHSYARRYHPVGEVYDRLDKDKNIKLLIKLGVIVPVPVQRAKPAAKQQSKKKRAYKRKDMQAEQVAQPVEIADDEPNIDIDEQAKE